jgi:hypothetical protein
MEQPATEADNMMVGVQRPQRKTLESVLAFVTGFMAVLFLGIGTLFLVVRSTSANVTFDWPELAPWAHFTLHRIGLGITLFSIGAWFAVLTRGLWQNRRYGRVMAYITLAGVAAIAIWLAVS